MTALKMLLLVLIATALVIALAPLLFVLQTLRTAWRGENIAQYFKTVALGLDQLGGSIIYNDEDWTISSMSYAKATIGREPHAIIFMSVIDLLAFIFTGQREHCRKSHENELEKTMRDIDDVAH